MKIPLQNISNNGSHITLFCREKNGSLTIKEDRNFLPYFYEKTTDKQSDAVSIFGEPLKKIYCTKPSDVRKQRSNNSFEADIIYIKQYILNKIESFEKSKPQIIFLDIEVNANELPHPKEDKFLKDPISIIRFYDNYEKKWYSWRLDKWNSEYEMLEDFCKTVKKLSPDIWCLDPNTVVKTLNGYKKIKDCKVDERILSMNTQNNYDSAKIIKKFNSIKNTLKFTTKTNTIISSFKHKFPVLNQDYKIHNNYELTTLKHAEDITIDDYFLVPMNYIESQNIFSDYHWLMGYYQADGTKGKNRRLEIKDNNLSCLYKAKEVLLKFNIRTKIKKYQNCYILYSVNSFNTRIFLEKIKYRQQNLIEYLNNLLPNEQLSFLAGLIDGDGCLSAKCLKHTTINKDLTDWMSYILWGNGIPNNIIQSNQNNKFVYTITIYQSCNNYLIQCQHDNKKSFTDFNSKHSLDVVPLKPILQTLIKKWNLKIDKNFVDYFYGHKKNINRKKFINIIEHLLIDNQLSNYKSYKLKSLKNFAKNYYFEKIIDIKPNGRQEVTEISLDKYHVFIGNNILTHNCSWNSDFDYYSLYYRIGEDFPKKISPIGQEHWRNGFPMPAGISIVDLMGLYAKYTLHKKDSYALMNVGNDELDYAIEEDFDFTDIEESDRKNKLDVEKMIKLDEKLKLFEYFDEIRIIARCLWEDLPSEMRNYQWQSNNSRVIDMLALAEAKRLNVVLPSKGINNEKGDVEGAYRRIDSTGLFKDLSKVDVSGDYPNQIIGFCLSPENLSLKPCENSIKIEVTTRENQEHKATYYFKQNPDAIVPSLTRKVLDLKNELKETLKATPKDDPKYKQLQIAYDSRKALANSTFGVLGMPFFRLYNPEVTDTITFLARDLLHYIEQRAEQAGHKIRYLDTDSIFHDGKQDITNKLNQWAIEWAMNNYKNENVDVTFDWEGYFSSIFIQAMCRYRGRLETSNGQKIETKGIQMKRKDAGSWVKSFQAELYDLILDGNDKGIILEFIGKKIEEMQKADIREIALPVKINKKIEDYKTTPKWLKPLEEAKKLEPNFDKSIGDRFYMIYCKSVEKIALGNKYYKHITIDDIDWLAMIEKNIFNLLVPIFKGLNWEIDLLDLAERYGIILGSQYRNKLLEELPNFEELKKYYSARNAKKRITSND
ncbi:MAG: DNA polymerase domain-containing protein [Candidatus Helarchaeota archaeon]